MATNLFIRPKGKSLYRYDLKCPPIEWDANYKSVEYQYEGMGAKNKIGAYFFYEEKEFCSKTAHNALGKFLGSSIWVTECNLKNEIKLLDLRETHIIRILDKLYEKNIDILRGDFKNYIDPSCKSYYAK